MDRNRGSHSSYRGSSKFSTGYSSRNFDSDRSSHGFSSGSGGYKGPKNYDSYPSEHGSKRRYDQTSDHRKSYDHHGGREGSPRKYYRSDSTQGYEGRSNHRSHHDPNSSSSNRGRYSYSNGSSNRHEPDSYHSERRFDDNRRYHQSSSSTNYRGSGGYMSSRGRGRGRATNRVQLHSSRHYSKDRDHKDDKECSRSPAHQSGDEELNPASNDELILSQEHQLDNNKEETSSQNKAVEQSEVYKSARDETDSTAYAMRDRSRDRSADPDATQDSKQIKSDMTREKSAKYLESDRSPKKSSSSKDPPEHFIRLQCPHCNQRSVTFREYILHLSSKRHAEALEKVSLQHRMSLAKLRTRQRKEQLQIEAQSAKPQHSSRMNFCAICKLYHSESRPNHETTELHKIIKNFLMPFCPICRVHFKSRMLYEKHVATLTHIKNKVNMEKTYERRREEERKQDKNGLENEEVFNLENFMTLDAVGSVDGDDDNTVAFEESPVGQDFVKKVEAYYCDVCKRYLARMEPLDKVIELHCRTRAHHNAFAEQHLVKKESPEDHVDETNDQIASSEDHGEEAGAELKRSESQERLWQETENDIGGIDDEAHSEEEGPLQIVENHEQDEASGNSESDLRDSEESNAPKVQIKREPIDHDNQ